MTLAPGFLVAFPHLSDQNFRQSVVLLLEQNEQGAMGVVVNHESPLLVRELCRDHQIRYGGDARKRVRRGGPLQPEQGLVLYGQGLEDPDGRVVLDGLHVSASRGTLSRLCGRSDVTFHCYSGYAGWGPGQLEREIVEGTWVIAPAAASMVLTTPCDEMWERVLREIGIDPVSLVPGGGEA